MITVVYFHETEMKTKQFEELEAAVSFALGMPQKVNPVALWIEKEEVWGAENAITIWQELEELL